MGWVRLKMNILDTNQIDFSQAFKDILIRSKVDIKDVVPKVSQILDSVLHKKTEAILEQVALFDSWKPCSFSDLEIPKEQCLDAYEKLPKKQKQALHQAYDRIYAFHSKQKPKTWLDFEENGNILGQKVQPMDRAGLYIPGGKAFYPSSLLMNAIPAIVAGVKEIVVCSPTPKNRMNDLFLATLHLCGITQAFKVGGASAIGMMAYGLENFKKVDVITGPGNIFVATAKKMVFGEVMIDMIAGPSEILVIADESANPKYIVRDLLSQAEHDEMARVFLLSPDKKLVDEVQRQIEELLPTLLRYEIAKKSIKSRGIAIVCKDIKECIALSNELAPEHLELLVENPLAYLPKIKHCGAIFIGTYAPEAIGDYIAGPNHTLPTSGSAKFFSPLGVEHFMKKSSIIYCSKEGFDAIAESAEVLADIEGLGAHKDSITIRKD